MVNAAGLYADEIAKMVHYSPDVASLFLRNIQGANAERYRILQARLAQKPSNDPNGRQFKKNQKWEDEKKEGGSVIVKPFGS